MWQMYVIFCIWSMQACEFNQWIDNSTGGYVFYSYNILFFALYLHCIFFGDCIAHTATAQKGVRNSGDISVICSFLAL